jgi:DNA-binding NarL/FixJ family response regulator
MSSNIKVMLIEDHAGYRETVTSALEQTADMELAGSFGTAEVALRSLQPPSEIAPDIILLDLKLPGMQGLEMIRWILDYAPTAEIIVLTQSDKDTQVRRALNEGASGYLLKSSTLNQILDGIRNVVTPEIARYLMNQLRNQPAVQTIGKALSERETEVLILLSEGLLQKEIAQRLGVSITTVAYHIKHIYEKLDVANAPAAIGEAYRKGVLKPTQPEK